MDGSVQSVTPPEGPSDPIPQPIGVLKACHLELMSAYVTVLMAVTSREHDPKEHEGLGLVNPSWVRRYAHAHLRRSLRQLSAGYTAWVSCLDESAHEDRTWFNRTTEEMGKLDEGLAPWKLGLAGRFAALLAAVGSLAGIVRNVDAPPVALDVALYVLIGVGFGFAANALWLLLMLRGSFLEKRKLFLGASIYDKERALFAALGSRRRLEPLTDLLILQILALVVGTDVGAGLALFEVVAPVTAVYIGGGVGLVGMYLLLIPIHFASTRRSPR